jgi:protein-tyrosine phosphatase
MMEKNDRKFEVLFVCTGNPCRSPTAEGILRKMLKQKGVGNVGVSSAGTHGLASAPASLFAAEVARAHGVDLSGHCSRRLTDQMVRGADLILTMSQEHSVYLRRIDKQAEKKTFLLRAFPRLHPASNEDQNGGVLSIEDPMGGSLDDYEDSFSEIEGEVKRIFPELLRLVKRG